MTLACSPSRPTTSPRSSSTPRSSPPRSGSSARASLPTIASAIPIRLSLDFLEVSSYGSGTSSSGVVRILKDLAHPIEGRHVIVVEDILDTGHTLSFVLEHLRSQRPASVALCTLLDKPARRVVGVTADYRGLEIPDKFVVGYGLDYAERYRNLPFIGVLKPEVYRAAGSCSHGSSTTSPAASCAATARSADS